MCVFTPQAETWSVIFKSIMVLFAKVAREGGFQSTLEPGVWLRVTIVFGFDMSSFWKILQMGGGAKATHRYDYRSGAHSAQIEVAKRGWRRCSVCKRLELSACRCREQYSDAVVTRMQAELVDDFVATGVSCRKNEEKYEGKSVSANESRPSRRVHFATSPCTLFLFSNVLFFLARQPSKLAAASRPRCLCDTRASRPSSTRAP